MVETHKFVRWKFSNFYWIIQRMNFIYIQFNFSSNTYVCYISNCIFIVASKLIIYIFLELWFISGYIFYRDFEMHTNIYVKNMAVFNCLLFWTCFFFVLSIISLTLFFFSFLHKEMGNRYFLRFLMKQRHSPPDPKLIEPWVNISKCTLRNSLWNEWKVFLNICSIIKNRRKCHCPK